MKLTIEEASISRILEAFKSGELTSRKLIEHYLQRIERYDRNDPRINSIVTLNRDALSEADQLDSMLSETSLMKGPLHGIPFLIKDQVETKNLRTTFGSIAFEDYIPNEDATVVKKIRASGGIVLGKASMPDFGVSWYGVSSIAGHTLNPYDTGRDPGGSSSGIGAGISANFATVGIGEDTAGSIRVPASFCNLYGIRVTTGIISRHGTSPIINFQDTLGPMARNVEDLATVLDVIVGYDSNDPATAICTLNQREKGYAESLDPNVLEVIRIGVLSDPMLKDTEPMILDVMQKAMDLMRKKGAEFVEEVSLGDLSRKIEESSLYDIQAKLDINSFISTRQGSPYKSLENILAVGAYHKLVDILPAVANGESDITQYPGYYRKRMEQYMIRDKIIQTLAALKLDAIIYPSVRILPPRKEEIANGKWKGMGFPVNSLISSHSGCPAIALPAGFTDDGLPVGVELIGRPFGEQTLLNIAYSFERVARNRLCPPSTPPL